MSSVLAVFCSEVMIEMVMITMVMMVGVVVMVSWCSVCIGVMVIRSV